MFDDFKKENMLKKLEEIWIMVAWIILLPLTLIFKLLGKINVQSNTKEQIQREEDRSKCSNKSDV